MASENSLDVRDVTEPSDLPCWGKVCVWAENIWSRIANSLLSKLEGHIRVIIRREVASTFFTAHTDKHVHQRRHIQYAIWNMAATDTHTHPHSTTVHYVHFPHQILSPNLVFAVMFSVHNSSSGVKLMLPHQEESTNNNQTLFSPLPTLFATGSIRLSLCSHAPPLLFSLLCIVLCPQVRGSLCSFH